MVKLAIVILNWNGKKLLENFLPVVVQNSPSYAKIVVVDNCSEDDSIVFLQNNYNQIIVVKNTQNGGYAKGYNDGLQGIEAEYYVLLNSDVEVTPNWIEPVVGLMDSDKLIAACQPKIKNYNQKNVFEYAGAAGGFIDKYGYAFCRGRIFNSFEEDINQYDDNREIFWATGACLFIRSEYFRNAGGFDEDFYAHMEEIDLCWRLKNAGKKIMYCSESIVYHVGGGTLSKINPRKTYLNFRNNLILFFKNHSSRYFWIKVFIRMLLDGVAAMKFLLEGQFAHFVSVFKAHVSFYKSFPVTYAKRRKLKKEVNVYTTNSVYRKSIVVDYFLFGKKKFSDLNSNFFNAK